MNDTITSLKGRFESDNSYNSNTFLKTKIRTFAFGKNRNQSDIVSDSFTEFSNARNSIKMIPIVAKYNQDKDDLEGHNVSLRENKSGELEWYYDTAPLGFVSPNANVIYEEVNEGTDDNPDYKTYVTVDEVYLWKRYDATKKIEEWLNNGIIPTVSMEIDNVKGKFDKDGYFQIHDFQFQAIAALGSDVEPCFKKAEISLFSYSDFKEDLKQLMFEINQTLESEVEGGQIVEEVKQEFEETAVEATEDTAQTEEQVEEETVEEAEATESTEFETEETQVEQVEEEVEVVVEEEFTQENEQIEEVAEETFSKEFVEGLQSQIKSLSSELESLKSYKRQREEQDLSSQFADKLSEEELNQVFSTSKDLSLEDVETKLLALFGKKNFSIKQEIKNENKIEIPVVDKTETINEPYNGLFSKYLSK